VFCTVVNVRYIAARTELLFGFSPSAMILQSNGCVMPLDQLALLLPAIEATLMDLQPIPRSPGNLTAFSGTYLASVLGGYSDCPSTVAASCHSIYNLTCVSWSGSCKATSQYCLISITACSTSTSPSAVPSP
jgi:hypothetical protein